jgi:DNA-binding response OmpR family regulator
MARVLVVEDDAAIGRALASALTSNGHDTVWAKSGGEALTSLSERAYELALLDLGLPDIDGLDLCQRIRAGQPACVIVILTAKDEEIDVVLGLEAGADDYLMKPFRLAELIARVGAHLRRRTMTHRGASSITIGELEIDNAARRVSLGGNELPLRAKEFDLLARLAASIGVAVSREDLMADVWDEHWFGSTKTLDVHVSALRRRLTDAGRAGEHVIPEIVTLRGRGFRLDDPTRGRAEH